MNRGDRGDVQRRITTLHELRLLRHLTDDEETVLAALYEEEKRAAVPETGVSDDEL